MIGRGFGKNAKRFNFCNTRGLRRSGGSIGRRILLTLVCGVVLSLGWPGTIEARPAAKPAAARNSIPEAKRPWAGKPWLAGALLTVVALLVAVKSARRSHLD